MVSDLTYHQREQEVMLQVLYIVSISLSPLQRQEASEEFVVYVCAACLGKNQSLYNIQDEYRIESSV